MFGRTIVQVWEYERGLFYHKGNSFLPPLFCHGMINFVMMASSVLKE